MATAAIIDVTRVESQHPRALPPPPPGFRMAARSFLRLNGVDVRAREVDPDDLRRRIGIVFQQPVTFHGSIRRNVTFAWVQFSACLRTPVL